MGHARFSRPQPSGRRRVERSGEPSLFLDVCRCRSGWHHERPYLAELEPLRRRRSSVPGRSRARARPSGGANLAAFLEPFTHHHHPGRASAPYLVYVRCTGPPKPERRMKMKHRIMSGLVLVPLTIVLTTTPAYAIFGSILAAHPAGADDRQSGDPNLQRCNGEDHF